MRAPGELRAHRGTRQVVYGGPSCRVSASLVFASSRHSASATRAQPTCLRAKQRVADILDRKASDETVYTTPRGHRERHSIYGRNSSSVPRGPARGADSVGRRPFGGGNGAHGSSHGAHGRPVLPHFREHREAFRRAGRGGGPPGDRFAPDCVGSSLDHSRACFPGPPAQWLRCSLAAAVKQRLQPLAGSNLQRRRRATAGSGGGEGGSPCRAPAAPASRQEEPERQRMRWRREEVCARCWGVVAAGDGVRVSGARRWIPGIAVG